MINDEYEKGELCNLTLFDDREPKSERDTALEDYPEELVIFAEKIMKRWSPIEKMRMQTLPEHLRQAELTRLMKKYRDDK